MKRLANRKAIVTGAGSGIGAATAELFAQEGAAVLAVDLPGGGLAQHEGRNGIICLGIDVTEDEAPQKIVEMAGEKLGGIDILMNNAGVGIHARVADTSPEVWDKTLAVNLTAPFRLCRAALPLLGKSAAGRIINVASVLAKKADLGATAYVASKAGIAGMTRNLAVELGKYGITVNSILPGAIVTGMTQETFDNPDIAAIWARKSPLNRLGRPVDIARGALFLAGDESSFVTGLDFHIDGGMLLKQ